MAGIGGVPVDPLKELGNFVLGGVQQLFNRYPAPTQTEIVPAPTEEIPSDLYVLQQQAQAQKAQQDAAVQAQKSSIINQWNTEYAVPQGKPRVATWQDYLNASAKARTEYKEWEKGLTQGGGSVAPITRGATAPTLGETGADGTKIISVNTQGIVRTQGGSVYNWQTGPAAPAAPPSLPTSITIPASLSIPDVKSPVSTGIVSSRGGELQPDLIPLITTMPQKLPVPPKLTSPPAMGTYIPDFGKVTGITSQGIVQTEGGSFKLGSGDVVVYSPSRTLAPVVMPHAQIPATSTSTAIVQDIQARQPALLAKFAGNEDLANLITRKDTGGFDTRVAEQALSQRLRAGELASSPDLQRLFIANQALNIRDAAVQAHAAAVGRFEDYRDVHKLDLRSTPDETALSLFADIEATRKSYLASEVLQNRALANFATGGRGGTEPFLYSQTSDKQMRDYGITAENYPNILTKAGYSLPKLPSLPEAPTAIITGQLPKITGGGVMAPSPKYLSDYLGLPSFGAGGAEIVPTGATPAPAPSFPKAIIQAPPILEVQDEELPTANAIINTTNAAFQKNTPLSDVQRTALFTSIDSLSVAPSVKTDFKNWVDANDAIYASKNQVDAIFDKSNLVGGVIAPADYAVASTAIKNIARYDSDLATKYQTELDKPATVTTTTTTTTEGGIDQVPILGDINKFLKPYFSWLPTSEQMQATTPEQEKIAGTFLNLNPLMMATKPSRNIIGWATSLEPVKNVVGEHPDYLSEFMVGQARGQISGIRETPVIGVVSLAAGLALGGVGAVAEGALTPIVGSEWASNIIGAAGITLAAVYGKSVFERTTGGTIDMTRMFPEMKAATSGTAVEKPGLPITWEKGVPSLGEFGERLGGIESTELIPGSVGAIVGYRGVESAAGVWKTRGMVESPTSGEMPVVRGGTTQAEVEAGVTTEPSRLSKIVSGIKSAVGRGTEPAVPYTKDYIGYSSELGYPFSSDITAKSLTESFTKGTFLPEPEGMYPSGVEAATPVRARLPGTPEGEIVGWTGREIKPPAVIEPFSETYSHAISSRPATLIDRLLGGTQVIPWEATEIPAIFSAPGAEYTFAQRGVEYNPFGAEIPTLKSSTMMETTGIKEIKPLPKEVRGSLDDIARFMYEEAEPQTKYIRPTKGGGPTSKVEFESFIPPGSKLVSKGKAEYYSKMGGVKIPGTNVRLFSVRVPIEEFEVTPDIVHKAYTLEELGFPKEAIKFSEFRSGFKAEDFGFSRTKGTPAKVGGASAGGAAYSLTRIISALPSASDYSRVSTTVRSAISTPRTSISTPRTTSLTTRLTTPRTTISTPKSYTDLTRTTLRTTSRTPSRTTERTPSKTTSRTTSKTTIRTPTYTDITDLTRITTTPITTRTTLRTTRTPPDYTSRTPYPDIPPPPRITLGGFPGLGGETPRPGVDLGLRRIVHPIATPEQMIGKGVFNIKFTMPKFKGPEITAFRRKGGILGLR